MAPRKNARTQPAKRRSSGPPNAGPATPADTIRTFRTRQDFAKWLEKNHQRSAGIWARIAKKGGGLKSMTYQEGLDVALSYGWIDALKRPENATAWLQRFVPRRPKSLWSKINREKALSLIERGEMRPAGHAEIERAKQDGRWDAAYDSPAQATVPAELEAELGRRPGAKAFFDKLDKINRYAIIWRVQTAKTPETRARRVATLVDMLEKGQTIH